MSSSSRKTYDTDSIALRRIFAYDTTNSPFSTGFVLTSLTRGSASFVSPTLSLSTIGVPELPATLSTLAGELLSTAQLVGSILPSSVIVFLPSTVQGLGTSGYLSTSALGPFLASTIQQLGSLGYVSTLGLNEQLGSTLEGLGTFGYLSSGVVTVPITSTVIGLGTVGYVSSTQLVSTVEGLGTVGFVSSPQLVSTVQGLGTLGYVSTSQLISSVISLGTLGYVSTSQLVSSVTSLGTLGYISTSQLRSTVAGLAQAGYVSSMQLTSSLVGLGTLGYLSTSRTFRSTYANLASGNFSNASYLFSSITSATISLSTIRLDLGGSLRTQIIPSTTRLDIEFKQNVQFGFYDATSRNYEFNSFLVRGSSFAMSNIIGQESLQYYILNANPINLSFFFQEKTRFLITNPLVLSTLRNDGQFSSLTLHHTFGSLVPTTNQFFASPASLICATVVLDNTV